MHSATVLSACSLPSESGELAEAPPLFWRGTVGASGMAVSASLETPSSLVRTEAAVPDAPAASALSVGAIAGIVVASCIALLSSGALLLLYMHKRTTSTSVEHAVDTEQHAPKTATMELPPSSQNPSPRIPAGPALAAE
jgi:hypothetical protein